MIRLLWLLLFFPLITRAQNPCVNVAVNGTPCAPASFQLFACTDGAVDAQWSFPGSSSPSQSGLFVNAVYPNSGTFTVTVNIELPTGSVDTTFSIVVSEAPNICVATPQPNGCTGQTLCFDAGCTSGTGVTYEWNFGDGGSSTLEQPCHDFVDTGCYDIALVATDSFGCVADTLLSDFACVAPSVIACFEALNSPCNCSAPYTVQLMSCSTPSSDYFLEWMTPGGTQAGPNATVNPVTYNTVGFYDVGLVVSTLSGCSDTATMENFVCISSFSPTFEILDSTFVTGVPITFLSGPATSFAWSVTPSNVDTTDNDQSVTVVFNQPGSYDVCLMATFNGCAAEKCTTVVINNPTSVETLGQQKAQVFYNGNQKTVTVNINHTNGFAFELVDITGRRVYAKPLSDNSTNAFDVSFLPTGVYAYRLFSTLNTNVQNGLVVIR